LRTNLFDSKTYETQYFLGTEKVITGKYEDFLFYLAAKFTKEKEFDTIKIWRRERKKTGSELIFVNSFGVYCGSLKQKIYNVD